MKMKIAGCDSVYSISDDFIKSFSEIDEFKNACKDSNIPEKILVEAWEFAHSLRIEKPTKTKKAR